VLSTIAASHTRAQLAHGASHLGGLTSGYQLALGVGAVTCLVGALTSIVLLRSRADSGTPEPACPASASTLGEAPAH
jgi:hypothetical protein